MSVVLVIFSFKLNFSIHKELTNLLLRIAFANKQYAIGFGHSVLHRILKILPIPGKRRVDILLCDRKNADFLS